MSTGRFGWAVGLVIALCAACGSNSGGGQEPDASSQFPNGGDGDDGSDAGDGSAGRLADDAGGFGVGVCDAGPDADAGGGCGVLH